MDEHEDGWTPVDITEIIANPFSAITFDSDLFGEHDPIIDEETWVRANVKLVEEFGAGGVPSKLLVILKGGGPKGPDGGAFGYQRKDAQEGPGRHRPCRCGSGRKYKHCHGRHQGSTGSCRSMRRAMAVRPWVG